MPKGALLHCHLDATVNAKFLLKLALQQPAIHVSVPTPVSPLNASTLGDVLPKFRALPADEFTTFASLTSESYGPGTWVSLRAARENFPLELGGPEGFDKWVISSMTISPAEAYQTHNSVKKVRYGSIMKVVGISFSACTDLAEVWERIHHIHCE